MKDKVCYEAAKTKSRQGDILRRIKNDKLLYILLLPSVVLVILFSYLPMGGIKMAFQDYNIFVPSESTWAGLKNFKEIFTIQEFIGGIKHTVIISMLNILLCFPASIIFALLLNEIKNTYLLNEEASTIALSNTSSRAMYLQKLEIIGYNE